MSENRALLSWMGVFSVVFFIAGILFAPLLVIRLPADFFVRMRPPLSSWAGRHPVGRHVLHAAKNALGAVLVLLGIALLVLPGQGILTILMGLGLIEFPGKRHFELAIVRRPAIRRVLNGIRVRAGRAPFVIPEAGEEVSSPDAPAEADRPEEERL